MARIRDTTPAFDAFARWGFLESPAVRENEWGPRYESQLADVFEAFYARAGEPRGKAALVGELSQIRKRVEAGRPVLQETIERVEPAVRELLGVPDDPSPLHVLMVGPYASNAVVARLGGDVALFHCLEWFAPNQATDVLVAHEDTHAWHAIGLGDAALAEDAAWLTFAEGMAIQVSRAVVPGRDEQDYFWYGHQGFEDWLPWCRDRRDELIERFGSVLDHPDASDTWFGGGLVDGQWRVGQFIADEVVRQLGMDVADMAALDPDDARARVRAALTG